MLRQIKFSEITGRTVAKAAIDSPEAVIAFTDGTFVSLESAWMRGESYSLVEAAFRPSEMPRPPWTAIQAGVLTKEEYDAARAPVAGEVRAHQERMERALYGRLKAKYEPEGTR